MSDQQTLFSADYRLYSEILERHDAQTSAAEVHGLICGLICAGREDEDARYGWMEHVFEEPPVVGGGVNLSMKPMVEALDALWFYSVDAIGNDNLEYELLLPDDDSLMAERAMALGQWCQGFLFGLGLAEVEESKLPEEAVEMLRDIEGISRVSDDDEASEEAEVAYAEIIEYLRMGVLYLHSELNGVPEPDLPAPSTLQ